MNKIFYSELDKNSSDYERSKFYCKFHIKQAILKTHYKKLARISSCFNLRERNSGYIKHENKDKFLDLVKLIEKSNEELCKKSYESAKNNVKKTLCNHDDLGSLGYKHGDRVACDVCGEMCEVW